MSSQADQAVHPVSFREASLSTDINADPVDKPSGTTRLIFEEPKDWFFRALRNIANGNELRKQINDGKLDPAWLDGRDD